MPTLRKFSKSNKIKNRYNIIMKYKSKKINRKRYYKRQSKKRMYGGSSEISKDNILIRKSSNNADKIMNNITEENKMELPNNLSVQQSSNDSDEIMNKIEEQNKIEIPKIQEIPIIGHVIEKTGNLIEGTLVKGLDLLGDSVGIDIDNPESFGKKLDDIKDAVINEENLKKTKEILANTGKYIELGIDAASPVLEKTADKILPVVTKETDKAVKAGFGTLVNLAEDVAGPIIGIPRTILSATEALNASINAGSELIKGTSEVIQGTQENYKRLINDNIPKAQITRGGSSLKKMNKEAIMVSGRINDAKLDFLNNNVNRLQILQKYGGNLYTKRYRNIKRNLTSRIH